MKKSLLFLGLGLVIIATFLLWPEKTANLPTQEYSLETKDVTYFKNVKGFLARPNDKARHPGVVLVHEWWGLNEYIKNQAVTLAKEGYVVLAVDLYQGNVATDSTQAQQYRNAVTKEESAQNIQAALEYLKQYSVTKVATLGWCFGGGQVMNHALTDTKLDASIIYYGTLVTDETQLKRISWPVLGIFGEKDTSVTAESARAFENALTNLSIPHETYIYPNVGHAFANPSSQNFNSQEAVDAWEKTLLFLEKNLQ